MQNRMTESLLSAVSHLSVLVDISACEEMKLVVCVCALVTNSSCSGVKLDSRTDVMNAMFVCLFVCTGESTSDNRGKISKIGDYYMLALGVGTSDQFALLHSKLSEMGAQHSTHVHASFLFLFFQEEESTGTTGWEHQCFFAKSQIIHTASQNTYH